MKMMVRLPFAVMVVAVAAALAAPPPTCPESCECAVPGRLSCRSFGFLQKLGPKQMNAIVHLAINDANLTNVDVKLRQLKNLATLDLAGNDITLPAMFPHLPKLRTLNISNNHLTDVTLPALPRGVETLDLSSNALTRLPADWRALPGLRTLQMDDNRLYCDCDALLHLQDMVKGGLALGTAPTCYSPAEFRGRTMQSLNCSMIADYLFNTMQGDEGSGASKLDVFDDNDNPILINDEDEYIAATNPPAAAPVEPEVEGSGEPPLFGELPPPKPCHINCSTPKPVGSDDEADASPPPPLKEQMHIIIGDIFGSNEEAKATTTTTITTTTTTTTTKAPATTAAATTTASLPPVVRKEVPDTVAAGADKGGQVETFPVNHTRVLGEMERASMLMSDNLTILIVVGGVILLFVIFVVAGCVVVARRRRSCRRRNKISENGQAEELQPLDKGTVTAISIKPLNGKDEPVKPPEEMPLMNGQNGKTNIDAEAQKPLLEERQEVKEVVTSPQLERVMIKVGELPGSIPKTPLLVRRQINNDGEIITTALNN